MNLLRHITVWTTLFLLAVPTAPIFGAEQPANLTASSAKVFRGSGGITLTLPSQAAPTTVVTNFLRLQGAAEETLASLRLRSENRAVRTGMTHLRFEQEVDGLRVYGTYIKASFNREGALVHLIENLAKPPAAGIISTTIDERAAFNVALEHNHPGLGQNQVESSRDATTTTFAAGDFFFRDPSVTRIAIVMESGLLQTGYLVETWTDADNLLLHTLVGGHGRILGVERRTNNDSYNIFPDHPGNSNQTLTDGPGTDNTESPDGWLSGVQTTVNISGNNVHAYLDTDANNTPDNGGSEVVVGDGNFNTPADLTVEPETVEPETVDNKAVAVQNLFYFNNVIHDKLYHHGFTESAGNFQEDNFNQGGAGSDPVNAEAQDGSGTNNANFATPNDGSSPRMQMFLWTQTVPKRDGDLDSDIIWHEYGHGLTWRMIGNMSGSMSGAIGEGMSDGLAILINENDVVGEYSLDDPGGIRSDPYTNYPRTYGDFGGNSVHFDGEIYAAIIWRLWEIFQAETETIIKDTLFEYVVGGMNFTPAGPAFEDMRDGILQAASGSGHECLIWKAFADFGVGVGAEARVKGGGPFGGRVTVNESFQLPAECEGTPPPPEGSALTIDSCSPPELSPGERGTISVLGTGFEDPATVTFEDRIAVQSVTWVNSGNLSVAIKVHKRITTGNKVMFVTNPNGQSSSSVSCITVN